MAWNLILMVLVGGLIVVTATVLVMRWDELASWRRVTMIAMAIGYSASTAGLVFFNSSMRWMGAATVAVTYWFMGVQTLRRR